ncbi:zinc ribbon domain-containing protein [Corallococcus sp. H22C18031201]|nr:zinc ribbon domain-containing protein [Corallococcus sp. H22C18031201]
MRCPECGENATDARLKYCENCGAQMPVTQAPTRTRTAIRAARPVEEPAYASEIIEEAEEHARPSQAGAARPGIPPVDEGEDTNPGANPLPFDGPRWLRDVPAHSPSIVGVGLVTCAVVLGILPFFSSVGLAGGALAVLGGVALVARELRVAGERPGWVEWVPLSLMRSEVAAGYALLLAALALRSLSLGFTPLLWLAGAGLVVHDQYRKVYAEPDGVGRYFEPRRLVRFPAVVALAGVALCLGTLYLPWTRGVSGSATVSNAPVPGRGSVPPELRVVEPPRASDDSLYSAGGYDAMDSGWDRPASLVPELALLAVLLLAALHDDVARPAWMRFVPAGAVGVCLLWALMNMRIAVGPIAFVFGLGAVGFLALRLALGREEQAPPPPELDTEEG